MAKRATKRKSAKKSVKKKSIIKDKLDYKEAEKQPQLVAAINLHKNLNCDIQGVINDIWSKVNKISQLPERLPNKDEKNKTPDSAIEAMCAENSVTNSIYNQLVEINNHLYTII